MQKHDSVLARSKLANKGAKCGYDGFSVWSNGQRNQNVSSNILVIVSTLVVDLHQ